MVTKHLDGIINECFINRLYNCIFMVIVRFIGIIMDVILKLITYFVNIIKFDNFIKQLVS